MAEKIVNNGIVFAYASNDAVFEIKKELERYFLYQTILVVDENYEYGRKTEALRQTTNCNFIICHDFRHYDFCENIDLVLAVNAKNIFEIKNKCFKNKIPYMIVLTKVVSHSVCGDKILDNYNQMLVNKPFGIVFDKSEIFDKKKFICQAVLEIGMTNFDILQNNILNLFCGKHINYDLVDDENKNLNNLICFFDNKNFDLNSVFDKICDTYVTNILKRASDDVSLLEILSMLYCSFDKELHDNFVETKYTYMQVLSLIELQFFERYQSGYKDQIDYATHQKKLAFYGKSSDFCIKSMPENKINFLVEQFQHKFLEYMRQQNDFTERIKNFVADIDVDFLYNLSNNINREIFVDMISLTPTICSELSFLTILFSLGLLNYCI